LTPSAGGSPGRTATRRCADQFAASSWVASTGAPGRGWTALGPL
jgi:hypothetical protein